MLNKIKMIEATKTTNNSAMLRQPSENHFQFRFHQFSFGVGGIGGVCSTQRFYVEAEVLGNESLRLQSKLDAFSGGDTECRP